LVRKRSPLVPCSGSSGSFFGTRQSVQRMVLDGGRHLG
jgi:hypothetical protein